MFRVIGFTMQAEIMRLSIKLDMELMEIAMLPVIASILEVPLKDIDVVYTISENPTIEERKIVYSRLYSNFIVMLEK